MLLYIVIFTAIVIGWLLGRRERPVSANPPTGYYSSLNLLLNDDPDQAAVHIRQLEVNSETLETHLALGGLLRRRGELDQAMRVHEHILQREQLDADIVRAVELELARDYLLAGLLDRAEKRLLPLADYDGDVSTEANGLLREIYEREKDWRAALGVSADASPLVRSHYHAELAEAALVEGDLAEAKDALRLADREAPTNPRVHMLRARVALADGQPDDAIRSLTKIRDDHAVFVPETLALLEEAWSAANRPPRALREYLESCLELVPSISVVLKVAALLRDEAGDLAVSRFIAEHLKTNPRLRGLSSLIDLHIDNTSGVARENLTILRSFTEALVADKPTYRCGGCGLPYKIHRWHCPSCRRWGTIEAIFGLEGE